MEGGILGPLLSCILTDQFLRLKKGDSYWYERRVGVQKFTKGNMTVYCTISIFLFRQLTKLYFRLNRSIESNLQYHIGWNHLS